MHWIHTSPHLLQTFVANRVSQIREITNTLDWRHVRSHDNPADALSRGQLPSEFVKNELWFRGPNWLTKSEAHWLVTE